MTHSREKQRRKRFNITEKRKTDVGTTQRTSTKAQVIEKEGGYTFRCPNKSKIRDL